MTIKRNLWSRYPRFRKFLISGKLYLTHPHHWIPALKTLARQPKARKIGITIIRPKDTYIFRDIFNSSSNIIDVGCGQDAELSLYLISRYGLKAYGVDPTIKHQDALKMIEDKTGNRFQHIKSAVSSKEGEMTFYETLDHESGSFYEDHKNIISDRIRSYTVKTMTISGLVKHLNLQSVDLIKLDLEGAEYELFNDIDLNELNNCRQIYIEFHHHAFRRYTRQDTNKIVDKFRNNGFKVFSLEDYNYLFYRS
jgi:FkbM family methyltransferase